MGIASAFALRATADKSLHPFYGLILYPGKIRHRAGGGADFVQELQAIFAHLCVVVVDFHLVEERVHRGAQLCHRAHRACKIFNRHGCAGFGLDLIGRFRKRL